LFFYAGKGLLFLLKLDEVGLKLLCVLLGDLGLEGEQLGLLQGLESGEFGLLLLI
jgi:hypothetical protein